MKKDGIDLHRIGDARAPYWFGKGQGRLVFALGLLGLVFALAVTLIAAWRTVDDGEPTRILGFLIGVPIALVISISLYATWILYWTKLRTAVAREKAAHPGSLVIGGRLPRLAVGVIEDIWPTSLAPIAPPQHVVVSTDEQGVTMIGVNLPPTSLLELPWRDVVEISPVEYVEDGKAYDGLALVGPNADCAIVFQAVLPGVTGVRFPRAHKLAAVADDMSSFRPTP